METPILVQETNFNVQNQSVRAFSADGTKVATISLNDANVYIWDVTSGELLRTYEGHSYGVSSVTIFSRWNEGCVGII